MTTSMQALRHEISQGIKGLVIAHNRIIVKLRKGEALSSRELAFLKYFPQILVKYKYVQGRLRSIPVRKKLKEVTNELAKLLEDFPHT